MTTVIFVHGTGIRERKDQQTFELIQEKIHAQRPDINVAYVANAALKHNKLQ